MLDVTSASAPIRTPVSAALAAPDGKRADSDCRDRRQLRSDQRGRSALVATTAATTATTEADVDDRDAELLDVLRTGRRGETSDQQAYQAQSTDQKTHQTLLNVHPMTEQEMCHNAR